MFEKEIQEVARFLATPKGMKFYKNEYHDDVNEYWGDWDTTKADAEEMAQVSALVAVASVAGVRSNEFENRISHCDGVPFSKLSRLKAEGSIRNRLAEYLG